MSRYQWTRGDKEFSIGWDPPLNTFFAQIHNNAAVDDKDYCELWLGQDAAQFPDIPSLLAKFPEPISEELQFHLLSDQYGIDDAQDIKPLPEHITKRF
jgi:hypothetical protein